MFLVYNNRPHTLGCERFPLLNTSHDTVGLRQQHRYPHRSKSMIPGSIFVTPEEDRSGAVRILPASVKNYYYEERVT